MESISGGTVRGTFTCELCGLTTPFTYFGQKPPNTRAIVLLEESFVLKDPFSPEREKFIVLGSCCTVCQKSVCVGTECSLFYTKRFCLPCVREHLDQFPQQIITELAKKKPAPSHTDSTKRSQDMNELHAQNSDRSTLHQKGS